MRRRTFVCVLGTAGVGGVAGCLNRGGESQSGYGNWFSDVENFDGTVDRTGTDQVTVEVGVEQGGGFFGFGPPAVKVDTGTTVVWQWTGKGGSHNVVADDGSFQSEFSAKEGHTYEHTFDESGTFRYYCKPHKSLEMKGAVDVVG